MARIIVNDFPAGPARGGRDSAPTPTAQIAMVAREFAANDTTLRFSQCDIGGTGRRPVLRPARNPPGHSSSPARRRPVVRRHPRALPGPAVRANSRRPAPGRFSHVGVKIIRGASGLEFLFINARIGSIGKVPNIAPCGNAPGSFDIWSLIRGQIGGWPRWPSAEIMPFLAWFLPVDARPRTQPFQGGFVAAIGTEPVVADGRTCL
jgi:hypothetical protein